jgi:hypothetical protein
MTKKITNISKAFLDDLETLLVKHENILTKKYKGKEIEWTDSWEGSKSGIVDSAEINKNCDGEWEFLMPNDSNHIGKILIYNSLACGRKYAIILDQQYSKHYLVKWISNGCNGWGNEIGDNAGRIEILQ